MTRNFTKTIGRGPRNQRELQGEPQSTAPLATQAAFQDDFVSHSNARNTGSYVIETTTLGRWASDWDGLAMHGQLISPFLRSWWLEATSTTRNHFLLVFDGPRLIGGLALERWRLGVVQYFRVLSAGVLCPDHIDLVAAPDQIEHVTRALRAWFLSGPSRILDLEGVSQNARILTTFPGSTSSQLDVSRYTPLTGSFDEYLGSRRRTVRQRVRKASRRSAAAGVEFRKLRPDEHCRAMDDYIALNRQRADRARLLRKETSLRRAIGLGTQAGEVEIFAAETRGSSIALSILFRVGNRLHGYQSARDIAQAYDHVGTALQMFVIERAIAEDIDELDFLRGDERHKHSFADEQRQLLTLRAAHGAAGRCGLVILLGALRLRRGAGRLRRWLRETRNDLPFTGNHQSAAQ